MKKLNPLPVALQLSHPDATFYSVALDGEKVTGLFAAHDNDQPFEVSFNTFLESAYKCSVIADYAGGQIYIPGDRTDRNARQWAEFWLVETAGTKDFFTVLSDAVYSEFETELTRLAREAASGLVSSSVAKRIYRTVDADFCDAIKAIAGIIEAVEAYQETVETANV